MFAHCLFLLKATLPPKINLSNIKNEFRQVIVYFSFLNFVSRVFSKKINNNNNKLYVASQKKKKKIVGRIFDPADLHGCFSFMMGGMYVCMYIYIYIYIYKCSVTVFSPYLSRNRKWAQQAQYNRFVREWVKELG